MAMEAPVHAYGVGRFGLSRTRGVRIAVTFLGAALVAGILLFAFHGKPTPNVAGLRQIPAVALTELKSRLDADGRRYRSSSPGAVGTLTRSLTGAVLLSSGPGTLRFEVSTQYYFRLKDKPAAGPDSWLGRSDGYSVRLMRTSRRPWQVASIKLLPPPHVQGQG
jgi:hypothetical protein